MKQQSTSRGFAVLTAATIAMKFLSLIYVPFLTVIITHAGYGIYAAAYQVFTFIYVIANSGISIAISKIIAEFIAVGNPKDAKKSFKIARALMLLVGFVLAMLMLILSKPLANMMNCPQAVTAIRFLTPTIMITPVLSVYRGYFQGKRNMTPTALSQVMEQVANLIFSLLFAEILIKKSLELGCAGGTVGTTLGAVIALTYLIITYEKDRNTNEIQSTEAKRRSSKYLARKIIKYALPITICMGMQYAGNLLDATNIMGRLIVAGFKGKAAEIKYADLAYYNTLLNVMISIISALSAAVLPAISGAAVLKNKASISHKINFAFRICFLMAVPYAVVMSVLSVPLYSLISFFRGTEGASLLLKGSPVVIFWSIVMIQSTILQGMGKLYSATSNLIIGIIIKIAINYILVAKPGINIMGAVIGSLACYIIPMILNHIMIKRELKIDFNLFKHSGKPIIASAFMGLVVFIVYFNLNLLFKGSGSRLSIKAITTILNTGICGILGVLSYIFSLILIGGITQKDMDGLPDRFKKFIPGFLLNRLR